jgi:hypothetical protein
MKFASQRRAATRLQRSAGLALAAFALCGAAPNSSVAGSWEGELHPPKAWPIFVQIDIDRASGASTLSVLGQKVDAGHARGNRLTSNIGDEKDPQWLRAKVDHGKLRGTLKGGGVNLAFSLARIPELKKTRGRVAGWAADLDAIRDRILRYDRSFSATEARGVRARIASLRKRIAGTSDDAMRVEIARLLAMARNAHTRLYLLRNRTEIARLPIRLWWFGDELRIIRAAPGNEDLLGCRVTRIGTMPVADAYAQVADLYSGSGTWRRYMSQYTLTAPAILHGAGIQPSAASTEIGLDGCRASGGRTLAPMPYEHSEHAVESWWDLAPRSPSKLVGWNHVQEHGELPLYLSHADEAYWLEAAGTTGIFCVQLTRAGNYGDQTIADFARGASQEIARAHPRAIVVDLRFNTGGDSNITKVLVDALVKAADKRPIYLITSRSTFSAGIVAAAQFRQGAKVTIVGEPAGDGLEFWAEGGNIILPYSGLAAHFANGAHSLSPRGCPTRDFCDDLSVPSLAPDIAAPLSWSDYRAGLDPSLRAIEADLKRTLR